MRKSILVAALTLMCLSSYGQEKEVITHVQDDSEPYAIVVMPYIGTKFNSHENFGMQWNFHNLRTNIVFGFDAMVDVKYGTNAIAAGKIGKIGNKTGLSASLGVNVVSTEYSSKGYAYYGGEFLYMATEEVMLSLGYSSKGITVGISRGLF